MKRKKERILWIAVSTLLVCLLVCLLLLVIALSDEVKTLRKNSPDLCLRATFGSVRTMIDLRNHSSVCDDASPGAALLIGKF
jgi:hypothetical protein